MSTTQWRFCVVEVEGVEKEGYVVAAAILVKEYSLHEEMEEEEEE